MTDPPIVDPPAPDPLADRRRSVCPTLETDWTYRASTPAARVRLKRLRWLVTGRRPPPRWWTIRPVFPAARWNILFLYVPRGVLDADQRDLLARLKALDGSLLVVFASECESPPAGLDVADALIGKEVSGFDFSAYRIALDAVANAAPGATAYVQNDSVLGPFADIDALVDRARWDLTGFIATRAIENHFSSFAFILRDVTPMRMRALRPVLAPSWACDAFDATILLQETRLARTAARHMSVGAFWYLPDRPASEPLLARAAKHLIGRADRSVDVAGDATIRAPIALLEIGFPFLKRSLFTKFAGLHDSSDLRAALRRASATPSQPADPG